MGFEWNSNNILISIMFKPNNSYVYSIITDTISDYGENKQNSKNQQDLLLRISDILAEGAF